MGKKKRFCIFNYITAAAAVSSAIRIQKEFLYNDAFFGYLTIIYIIIGTYLPRKSSNVYNHFGEMMNKSVFISMSRSTDFRYIQYYIIA